eukprot:scaffold38869_cov41-Phaeocystis_antarctica.AAC.1
MHWARACSDAGVGHINLPEVEMKGSTRRSSCPPVGSDQDGTKPRRSDPTPRPTPSPWTRPPEWPYLRVQDLKGDARSAIRDASGALGLGGPVWAAYSRVLGAGTLAFIAR